MIQDVMYDAGENNHHDNPDGSAINIWSEYEYENEYWYEYEHKHESKY